MADEYVRVSDLNLLAGVISTWAELSHLHPEVLAGRLANAVAVAGMPVVELFEERSLPHNFWDTGSPPRPAASRLVGWWTKVNDDA